MKTMMMAALVIAVGAAPAAFGSAAVQYSCVGKDSAQKQTVQFEVLFSESGGVEDPGYANQSITIRQRGGIDLEKPQVFQMAGATAENHCRDNELGETYLQSPFEMEPLDENTVVNLRVKFRTGCEGEKNLDVQAYCVFAY